MPYLTEGFVAVVLVTIALVALVALRPSLVEARGGRILAFLALCVLPLLMTGIGVSAQVEHSKSTAFCLSCHVDRKSTRLNSSHLGISYAVFCLKKKNS